MQMLVTWSSRPRPNESRGGSTAGDGRQDGHLVAVRDLRVEAVLEANALAGDVDVDEAPQVAVLGDPLPQAVVLVEDRVESLADRGALNLEFTLTAGGGAELGGNLDCDAHRRPEILVIAANGQGPTRRPPGPELGLERAERGLDLMHPE